MDLYKEFPAHIVFMRRTFAVVAGVLALPVMLFWKDRARESDLRLLVRLHTAIKKPPTAMWRFFYPSGFAVRWVVFKPSSEAYKNISGPQVIKLQLPKYILKNLFGGLRFTPGPTTMQRPFPPSRTWAPVPGKA